MLGSVSLQASLPRTYSSIVGARRFMTSKVEVRISRRDRALLRDVQERIALLPYEAPTIGIGPEWLPAALTDLLRCERSIAYRAACRPDGTMGLGERVTTDEAFFSTYDARLMATGVPFLYDSFHPEPTQRNRTCRLDELHTHGPDANCVIEDVWPSCGLRGHDQLRALVCDGPVLLAWVGGFREELFTSREHDLLTALIPPLQWALSLRRKLVDAGISRAGLAAALEAIGAPCFVARRDGRIAHTNTGGTSLLQRSARAAHMRLRDAIAGAPDTKSFVARLDAPGVPECFLVVFREPGATLDARLQTAAQDWGASARERDVLRLLVSGDANKEIALKLGCSEVSVERRVTALLRKAKCDGRSRLIARFWAR